MFENLSAVMILREINLESLKIAILVISDPLNFIFGKYSVLKFAKIHWNYNAQLLELLNCSLESLNLPKNDFT